MLLYVHRDLRTIRDGEHKTATSTFTQLFVFQSSSSSMLLYVHRDLRTIRDGEPSAATSTFTHLPRPGDSQRVQCCFTSTQTARGAQRGHLDCHTAPGRALLLRGSERRKVCQRSQNGIYRPDIVAVAMVAARSLPVFVSTTLYACKL